MVEFQTNANLRQMHDTRFPISDEVPNRLLVAGAQQQVAAVLRLLRARQRQR